MAEVTSEHRLALAGPHYKIYERWVDSCTLEIITQLPDLDSTATHTWPDSLTAHSNHNAALLLAETRANRMTEDSLVGQSRRVRRIQTRVGTLWLGTNTGPPTWWAPRGALGTRADGTRRLMLGWLRLCVWIGLTPNDKKEH